MNLIAPFRGLLPQPQAAQALAAPPYDVLSTEEARRRAQDNPLSFLHISKAEIDCPAHTDPHSPAVYARAAENFARLNAQGILGQDTAPAYYHYSLRVGQHSQSGLVAVACVRDYRSNRIRKHEFTRPDKEDDRVCHIEALNAQTGPVLLAYPEAPHIDRLLDRAQQTPELFAVEQGHVGEDPVHHSLRRIEDPALMDALTQAFDALPALYIADGHHRSAAAARIAQKRAAADPYGSAQYFLSVIFPQHQMRILDYNRVVRDLNGLSTSAFLDQIRSRYTIETSSCAVRPGQPGEIGLYLPEGWHRLRIRPDLAPSADPVAGLDVSLLSDHVLAPILGITDIRRDQRIDFVGGVRGLGELERRVHSGEMAAAFALYPTSMDALMKVADAGQVMPPKSTWFEPKLADGLVSHVLD